VKPADWHLESSSVPADADALVPNGELKLNPELHPANGSASMIATTAVLVGPKTLVRQEALVRPKAMCSMGHNR